MKEKMNNKHKNVWKENSNGELDEQWKREVKELTEEKIDL